MKLVDQWHAVEENLPEGWEDVRLTLTTEQEIDLPRAAQLVGPMNPGRVGDALVFHVRRAGGAQGPQAARRLFARLDEARVWCLLAEAEVVGAPAFAARRAEPEHARIVEAWDAALALLPPDWSDLLGEVEVTSSDYLDPTALFCAPLNPTRDPAKLAFTFRCASHAGYGASPSMARRCFERLDEHGITGTARVLRLLSHTDNVHTQGPVWLVGGKTL